MKSPAIFRTNWTLTDYRRCTGGYQPRRVDPARIASLEAELRARGVVR